MADATSSVASSQPTMHHPSNNIFE